MGEERHIAGALLNYGSGGSFRELGLMIWRVMQANNSSKFAVATVPVGQHSRTTFCPGKMNSAFWKERSSGGYTDHQTLRRFVHCAIYGVYPCGLEWHCVDIGLSLVQTITVALRTSIGSGQGGESATTAGCIT